MGIVICSRQADSHSTRTLYRGSVSMPCLPGVALASSSVRSRAEAKGKARLRPGGDNTRVLEMG